ncbi:MAG: hypothetical protein Q4F99_06775, partial [bacterium]|nr:hypothetical protein [bacterium]
MKRSLKRIALALLAIVTPCLAWAAEPWAAWTDFTGLTGSKAPDISSTQNSINGGNFTFNLGSGVVQADGSIVTTGGSGTEAPYIDFNREINVGYNNNPITVVMTVEMPSALPADVVKPLFFIGSNNPSGLGLTLKALDETNGVTFGGAWQQEGSTWNTNNAELGFTADAVKPSQVVTLSSSTSSGGLPLKVMVDGAMTSAGSISGLTGGSYNATRITLGNFHNTGANTITYRIVNIAVFAGTSVSDADVTLVATKPTVYARTLESPEETWSAADQWDGGSAPEGSPVAANLNVTAENGSTLNLDAAVTLFALEVSGSEKLTMTGSGLNTLKTTINTDTDVSGITADLGAVTIAEGATLYVGLNTKWTSVSGAGTIKIEDAVISLNIAKNFSGGVTNATSSDTQIAGLAPVPGAAWVNLSAAGGNSALSATETSAVYWNGSAAANLSDANVSDPYTVTYSANNTYQWGSPSDQFLTVYLDDGGAHAQIGVQKIPFSKYSVIVYCATDQASRKFSPVTVNGTMYTVDETGGTKTTTAATDTFGACYGLTAQYANTTAGNAIKIDNLSGPLTIVGGGNANNARGGIAAIQIVNTGDIVKYATVAKTLTEDATYSALIDTAEDVETVTADITIADGKTLTIDKVPAVGELTVKTQSASDVVTVKIDLADPVQIREVLDLLDTDSSSGLVKMTLATYTGKAAWMAYEFNGNYTNSGSEGPALSWDGGGAFGNGTGNYTPEMMTAAHTDADGNGNSALRLPARPWRNVSSGYPAAFTAVMYAKAGTTANGVLVSFGSATGGQKNTVTLATGANPDKDEMRLVQCGDLQSVATDLVQNLAVPNSQKSNHLYAFAMYTQNGKTRAEVYVDGELLTTYTFDSVITLGTGLQVGSIHGGAGVSGLQALAFEKDESGNLTSYDPATMDFIRVYDCLLSEEMLQTMAEAYPYTSPSGEARRTLEGSDANWVEAEGSTVWSQATLNADGTSAIAEQNAPNAGTNIVLTATEATSLTINLPEGTTAYETLTINGDVTLVAGEGTEVLSVSGRTTINGNVTMPYNL